MTKFIRDLYFAGYTVKEILEIAPYKQSRIYQIIGGKY